MEGDLKELFEDLEDSRQDWKIKHSLYEILMVVFCSVSAGETSINGILAFARCKKRWLMDKANLTFPNGLPSYDTIRRMLGVLDPIVLYSSCTGLPNVILFIYFRRQGSEYGL